MGKEKLPDKVKEFRKLYNESYGLGDEWMWGICESSIISISKLPNIGILNEYKKLGTKTDWHMNVVLMKFCEFLLRVEHE